MHVCVCHSLCILIGDPAVSVGNLIQSSTGMYLEGFLRFWKPLIFWLAIGTTIDHHPGIYESMKQQTILCLVAHLRSG